MILENKMKIYKSTDEHTHTHTFNERNWFLIEMMSVSRYDSLLKIKWSACKTHRQHEQNPAVWNAYEVNENEKKILIGKMDMHRQNAFQKHVYQADAMIKLQKNEGKIRFIKN